MKKTFASKTFASKTFASGNWAGLGVAQDVVPVGEATEPYPRSREALAEPEGCPYPRQHVTIDAI